MTSAFSWQNSGRWGRSPGGLINIAGDGGGPQRIEQALQRLSLQAGSIPFVGLQKKGGLRSSVTPVLTGMN